MQEEEKIVKQKEKLLVVAFKFADLDSDASLKDYFIQYGLLWDPWSGKLPFTTQMAVMERTEFVKPDGTARVRLVCKKTYCCKEGDPRSGGGVSIYEGNRTFKNWENAEFFVVRHVSKRQFKTIDKFFATHSGAAYSTTHRAASYFLPAFAFTCLLRPSTYVDPDVTGYDAVGHADAPVWTCASSVVASMNAAGLISASARTTAPWDLRHLLQKDKEFAYLVPNEQVLSMLRETNSPS